MVSTPSNVNVTCITRTIVITLWLVNQTRILQEHFRVSLTHIEDNFYANYIRRKFTVQRLDKLTPFSYGSRQNLQNATCYNPNIFLPPRPHSSSDDDSNIELSLKTISLVYWSQALLRSKRSWVQFPSWINCYLVFFIRILNLTFPVDDYRLALYCMGLKK